MTDKDPKDMTASELLRWAALHEIDRYGNDTPDARLFSAIEGRDYCHTADAEDREALRTLADKIDAELAEARKDAICESKKPMWWFRNAIKCGYDWPEPRDGEKFRDYLHRCFLPRPRFEDGEPVQFGDDTDELDGVEKFIFTRSCGGSCQMQDADGNMLTVFPGDFVKRRAPEVLGADGKPIVEGETVYRLSDGTAWKVTKLHHSEHRISVISIGGKGVTAGGRFLTNGYTHTPPDTLERLRDDIAEWRADCANPGSGWDAKTAEWADRIDAIIRRTGGAK